LNCSERVICPSEDAKIRILNYFPNSNALTVHHELIEKKYWEIKNNLYGKNKPMRIGLIGAIGRHKGRDALLEAAKSIDPERFKFVIIGYCGPELPEYLDEFVEATGEYDDNELPNIIKNSEIHLAWFPVKWPETYCYALTPAINEGLPILHTGQGAFVERLEGRPLTWSYESTNDPEKLINLFEKIKLELECTGIIDEYERNIENINFYKFNYIVK
jgi:hypothetical protein